MDQLFVVGSFTLDRYVRSITIEFLSKISS